MGFARTRHGPELLGSDLVSSTKIMNNYAC